MATFVAVLAATGLSAPAAAARANAGLAPDVPADCSQDVTDAFNAWVNELDDGATIILKSGGCYLSNGTITFTNKSNITILGSGATIRRDRESTLNRPQLDFDMGGGFKVVDLTIQGSNFLDCTRTDPRCYRSDREQAHNILLRGVEGILVSNVNLKNAWGDAVTAFAGDYPWDGDGNGAVMSRNITVQGSTVDTAGRHAIACTACRNLVVRDNSITNVGWHVVDVEVEGKVWTGDVTIERNTYSKVYFSLLAAVAPLGQDNGPFVVRGNTQTDEPLTCQAPIQIGRSGVPYHTVKISDNKLHTRGNGIDVVVADAEITRNTIQYLPGGCLGNNGISLTEVPRASATHNTLIGFPSLYAAKPPNDEIEVCGNRTTETGQADQPEPC